MMNLIFCSLSCSISSSRRRLFCCRHRTVRRHQGIRFHSLLEFGPTFGVLFAATEKDANGKMPGRMPFRRFELCGMAGVSYTFKEHYGVSLRFVQTAIPVRVNDGYHSQQYLTKKQFSTEIAFSLFYQF